LLICDVVVDSRYHLVVVSPCRCGSREIIVHNAGIIRTGPQIQKFHGRCVDSIRGENIVREWRRSGGALGARALRIHDPSARIIDLINHNGLAAGVHAPIVTNSSRKAGFAYLREVASPFLRIGNSGSEWLACTQPEALSAQKPERPVSSTATRKVKGTAGIAAELILYPGRSRPTDRIQEKIVRVENLVAKIFVGFAVDSTCACLGTQVGNASRKSAPFRSEIAGLDFELLNRILRGN